MSDLLLPSVEFPKSKLPNLADCGLGAHEKACLRGWGMVEPYVATVAEHTPEQTTYYWLGKFTCRGEAPLILAPVPRGLDIGYTPWYFGIVNEAVLLDAVDPTDALFDAAIHSSIASVYNHKHILPIERLDGIIPSGYADPDR